MAKLRTAIGPLTLLPQPSVETYLENWLDLHYLCAWLETGNGYTVPDTLLLEQRDRNYSLNTNRFGDSGSLIEVFGKVIYERLTSHSNPTVLDSKYEGGVRKGSSIVFNWKIESQMPPTYVYPSDSSLYVPANHRQ